MGLVYFFLQSIGLRLGEQSSLSYKVESTYIQNTDHENKVFGLELFFVYVTVADCSSQNENKKKRKTGSKEEVIFKF